MSTASSGVLGPKGGTFRRDAVREEVQNNICSDPWHTPAVYWQFSSDLNRRDPVTVRCPGCRHQCRLLHAQPTQVAAAGAPAPSSGVQEQGRLLTLCSSRGGRRRHRSQNWQRQRCMMWMTAAHTVSGGGLQPSNCQFNKYLPFPCSRFISFL